MVVEAKFIVYDAMVNVIGFEKVFKGARSLFGVLFGLVDFDFGESDGGGRGERGEELEHRD